MSKRPRSTAVATAEVGVSALYFGEGLPLVPPLHASLSLLVRPSSLPTASSARSLLARLAQEDCVQAASRALQASRELRLQSSYAFSCALEASRSEAAECLEGEAALHARRAGEGAAASAGASLAPDEELTREAATSAAEASAMALRDYGLHSASARAVGVVQHGECGAAALLPPPALAADPTRLYAGRPLRGATTAAAYLGAEREAGFPPPHRVAWRFPLDASAASGAMDPHLVLGAREVLRRPYWPDRLHPRFLASAGRLCTRGVALAAQYDEAKEVEADIEALRTRALKSLAREGGAAI